MGKNQAGRGKEREKEADPSRANSPKFGSPARSSPLVARHNTAGYRSPDYSRMRIGSVTQNAAYICAGQTVVIQCLLGQAGGNENAVTGEVPWLY